MWRQRRLRAQLQRARSVSPRWRMSLWSAILGQRLLCQVTLSLSSPLFVSIMHGYNCHNTHLFMVNFIQFFLFKWWRVMMVMIFLKNISILINIDISSLCPVLCSGHGEYGGGRFDFNKCYFSYFHWLLAGLISLNVSFHISIYRRSLTSWTSHFFWHTFCCMFSINVTFHMVGSLKHVDVSLFLRYDHSKTPVMQKYTCLHFFTLPLFCGCTPLS